MQEKEFRNYMLIVEKLSINGVETRISRANKGEELLGYSFDHAVSSDDLMYDSLMRLKPLEDPRHNPIQNALRKYYQFEHGKPFPQLRHYKRH